MSFPTYKKSPKVPAAERGQIGKKQNARRTATAEKSEILKNVTTIRLTLRSDLWAALSKLKFFFGKSEVL